MRLGFATGLRLLLHARGRFVGALGGIAMAVAIMFVEAELLLGIVDSQATVAQLLRGDLVAMNVSLTNLHKWNRLDEVRTQQIAAVDGVAHVTPIYEGAVGMRNLEDGRIRRIVVFAFPPDGLPIDIGDAAEIDGLLKRPDTVLFDRRSRPIYGAIAPGGDIEFESKLKLRVAGFVDIGPDIVNDGALVMSEGTWLARFGSDTPIMAAIDLVPGADREDVRRRILARLPVDVAVLTPAEAREREIVFTLRVAPVGVLFAIGMLAGLIIGSVSCYQILFNEVIDQQRQYATLKAIGGSDAFLRRLILTQAFVLSWIGFAAGGAVAWFFDASVARTTGLPLDLSGATAMLVLALAMAMCAGAGLLAVRSVTTSDPAALY